MKSVLKRKSRKASLKSASYPAAYKLLERIHYYFKDEFYTLPYICLFVVACVCLLVLLTSYISTNQQSCAKSRRKDNYNRNNSTYTSLSKSSEKENGPCGLQNIGNTCFMNSILQCLAHTKPLLDYCLRDNYTMDINTTQSSMKGTLIREFSNLLQMMWKNTTNAVNPHSFKTQIQRFAPRFTGYSQQDAQEFLRYILQGLHDDVNRISVMSRTSSSDLDDHLTENQKASESWRKYLKTDNSKIVDIFVGQLKSTLKCCHCGHTSVTFDPFWDLSIPISKSYSSVRLSECLNLFTNEEILIGDEMPVCSRCKVKRKSTKSFTIQKFPEILVLHLKRFTPGDSYRMKLSTKVDFPLNLDLSSYSTSACSDRWRTYNLYAVSNHSGSTSSGHYTAFCKNPYSGQWQEFNDSRVSKNITTNDLVTAEAYILFYEISGRSSRL
ncbi:ubiquitin carboxyl-terminal hydrolase 2-like isoform X2 [Centruroides vittatus]|uniref:ubiquitin carboxyl-terminal hydrolase 2-like isoform X2 n=1 Tax=Centruroides vittatus TaxID=120091 RepID=UPI00350FB145